MTVVNSIRESALAEAAVPCLHLYFFGFFMMAFQIAGQSVMGVFLAEPISNFIGGAACFLTMGVTVLPELRKDRGE